MAILVTGGAGYIGSHTSVQLLIQGHEIIIVDNLCNSDRNILKQIERITGKRPIFYQADLKEKVQLEYIFEKEKIDAVIHFASLKAVQESVESPVKYYENNILATINLINCMNKYFVKKLIFSSSAAVYGKQEKFPIKEDAALRAVNPYAYTKIMNEQILRDVYNADHNWSIVFLRYFNPIGAHETGILGEVPKRNSNNLMPIILKVAAKEFPYIYIYGNDYDTEDGTCIRDYIHIMDVADGHIAALNKLKEKGVFIYNLGTGRGVSVLELIKTFEIVNHCKLPFKFTHRRAGDFHICYADNSKAQKELKWKAKRSLEEMCKDAWNFSVNYKQRGQMHERKE